MREKRRKAQHMRNCPACAAQLRDGAAYCAQCGERAAQDRAEPAGVLDLAASDPAPANPPRPLLNEREAPASAGVGPCRRCGTLYADSPNFCRECGAALRD